MDKYGPEYLENLDKDVLENPKFILEAVKRNQEVAKFIPEGLWGNTDFVLSLIETHPSALQYLPKKLQKDENLLIQMLSHKPQIINILLTWIKGKKDLTCLLIDQLHNKIQKICKTESLGQPVKEYVTPLFVSYAKLLILPLTNKGAEERVIYSLFIADTVIKKLGREGDLVKQIVQIFPYCAKSISVDLQKDLVFMKQLIFNNPEVMGNLAEPLYKNKPFCKEIIRHFLTDLENAIETDQKEACIQSLKIIKNFKIKRDESLCGND